MEKKSLNRKIREDVLSYDKYTKYLAGAKIDPREAKYKLAHMYGIAKKLRNAPDLPTESKDVLSRHLRNSAYQIYTSSRQGRIYNLLHGGDNERLYHLIVREASGHQDERHAKAKSNSRLFAPVTSILAGIIGLFLIITNFPNNNLQLSPGIDSANAGFGLGIILVFIAGIVGYSLIKK